MRALGLERPIGIVMLRSLMVLVLALLAGAGCDERPAPAAAVAAHPATVGSSEIQRVDPDFLAAIAKASFATSPPGHESLTWPELAPKIEAAREQLDALGPMVRPKPPRDPLAERANSSQFRAIAAARERALVYRAEAARLLARGDADRAGDELVHILVVSAELASWGYPASAEAASEVIEMALDALRQPDSAAMEIAMGVPSRARVQRALERLNAQDPAGRLRAMVQSASVRAAGLEQRARGADGPAAVYEVASRYVPRARLDDARTINRRIDEGRAFARALADSWDKPMRSAVTERLRGRQADDDTGVLTVLLADSADACDADHALRARIAEAIEALR